MKKCLYFLKMKLLLTCFNMSEEEQAQVVEISKIILIFYVRYWFQAPLQTATARNYLNFIANMLRYRPKIILSEIQS